MDSMDYLNPDEEFDLMYADELEMIDDIGPQPKQCSARKVLNFDSLADDKSSEPHVENALHSDPIVLERNIMEIPAEQEASEPEVGSSTSNNKRSISDLFGDIDDFDLSEDFDNDPKRFRLDYANTEDKDRIIIEKILAGRNKNRMNDASSTATVTKRSEFTYSRRVPKWAFFTLRDGHGRKLYIKLHSEEALNRQIERITKDSTSSRLLSVPYENVLSEANAIIDKKISDANNEVPPEETEPNVNVSELWVEKYKPISYMDLLSDEGTNRILLQWLKLWDKVVFNHEKPAKRKGNVSKGDDNKFTKKGLQLDDELDESGCPKFKIALICGPPGLGKTTLAHMIAKHAGYNVVEVNASDDRNPESFKLQLEAATQMKSVLGKSPKPNCLILDEIDGAPLASIDVLVKFSKGEIKKKTKKKGGKAVFVLKRPIICICNDVYVPALRPLRLMAFVVQFPPTSLSRLVHRLIDISKRENIKTDIGAMSALCEKTSNDIRTCLSTIYCLKDQPIRLTTIHKTNVGSKDMHKGLFTVWQEVFQNSNGGMNFILKTVHANGDYDRLAQGIYENFLNLNIKDTTMKRISEGLKWFCFMDETRTVIYSSQSYMLLPYLPYCFVKWNFLFSGGQRPKITYPNLLYEMSVKQSRTQQIVQEVLKGMEPKVRAHCHYQNLLMDILPYTTTILNPSIRPVTTQLLNNNEKSSLEHCVNTMIDYNLTFVQERMQDGSYPFVIDPNVDEVIKFPNLQQAKPLTYAIKMTISREIEQEKMRRLENSIHKGVVYETSSERLPQDGKVDPVLSQASAQEKTHHSQKLIPKAIVPSAKPTQFKDFFGRAVNIKPNSKNGEGTTDEIVKSDVWFHFKEGYSNAVRRSVCMKDLME